MAEGGSLLALNSVSDGKDEDPLEKAIAQAAHAKMDGIHVYTKKEDLLARFPAAVFPSWRLLFLVDSFTSRSKVTLDNVDTVKNLDCLKVALTAECFQFLI